MKMKIKNLYRKYEEIIVYLIVGGLTTLLNILAYFVFTHTFLNPENALELQIAEVLSWTVSVLFAYYTNRKYVFKKKNSTSFKEFISFISARITTLLIEMLIMYVFVSCLHFNDQIIKIIAQVVVIVLNYIFSKFIVFKTKENDK